MSPKKTSPDAKFNEIWQRHGLTHEAVDAAQKAHRATGCTKGGGTVHLVDRQSSAWLRCAGCGKETEVKVG
jgi:hypothetical protein